jgi:hypothetical protein
VKPSLPFNFSEILNLNNNIVGKPYRIIWRVRPHGWGLSKNKGLSMNGVS